jgi:two-component system phosphate regulon sensor histidine kinase PhoR
MSSRPGPAPASPAPRQSHTLRIVGTLLAVLVVLCLLVLLAYFLTGLVYRYTGSPPGLVQQLINTALGFGFLSAAVFSMGRYLQSRQVDWFRPIRDAIDRIAQGDFSARVDWHLRGGADHPMAQLADSVNKMAAELDQMERLRQEFVSNVSHEIQSPLTSIRGFARALGQDDLPPETRRHYLGIIENESMRLSKLSDNLLALASLDSEQMKLEPRPYRLDKQLRSLILACEPQWMEKELELDVALDEVSLTADEDLLSQVWINLLHNGIKFTPAGGCLRIGLRQAGDQVEVQVADSGIGIAAADQAHIFERFYKADPARRRTEGGNGLGLSIAKKIVELHHGGIAVASQLGEGATFTVTLPVRQ